MAQSYDSRSRKRIALLTSDLDSWYQAAFSKAVERCATRTDCAIITIVGREVQHPDADERTQNVAYDWVSSSLVDGAILLTGPLSSFAGLEPVRALVERLRPLPIVSIGIELPDVPSLIVDNQQGSRQSVEHLIDEHGCRRIAYIAGPPTNEEALLRLRGYRDALEGRGLVVDDRLIANGAFSLATGEAAMRELCKRAVPFDAVVAANDYMAMAAMKVLRERGIRVPEDVAIVGFDASPVARFAPRALSSVGQPIERIATAAVDTLRSLIGGGQAPSLLSFPAELELRESCGCGYGHHSEDAAGHQLPSNELDRAVQDFWLSSRDKMRSRLLEKGAGLDDRWRLIVDWLLDGVSNELDGAAGSLAVATENASVEAIDHDLPLHGIGRALLQMQRHFDQSAGGSSKSPVLERAWSHAQVVFSKATMRSEGHRALDQSIRFMYLRRATQRAAVALESLTMADEISRALPWLHIRTALVAVVCRDAPDQLQPVLLMSGGARILALGEGYPLQQVLPPGFAPPDCHSLLLVPLTFEQEVLGLLVLEGETEPLVFESLRIQIATTLKLGMLHRRILEETTANERLAGERLHREVAIAKKIQTALEPRKHEVDGLRIAAVACPADQVGGDYYDILPVAGGCWLCIGDVTGHGLLSGLIMLMIQSIIGTLARTRPDASPSELLVDVNRGIFPNLRERLEKSEFATVLMLRFRRDGVVQYAGSHESIIVCRAATGRCELIQTEGMWLGVTEDIRAHTVDRELRLVPGDLLVLYTDGLVEARNAENEQFGLDRVCRIIEERASAEPEAVRSELLAAVQAWAPVQQDDITCMVARYLPPTP